MTLPPTDLLAAATNINNTSGSCHHEINTQYLQCCVKAGGSALVNANHSIH